MSGECFATRQGGPFNGPLLTQLVEQIRNLGHAGVGQTSWGPTVFVAVPSQSAAEQLAADVRSAGKTNDFDVAVSPPNNRGARIEVGDAAQSG
jgi:predicted sugar kinase